MKNKRSFTIVKVGILIFIVSFVMVEVLIITNGKIASKEEVDYVIVLGAKLFGDIPSPALKERLIVAKDYLASNSDTKVVVSGGQGPDESISEAKAMKKYLVDNGVSEERILIEDKSTSTYENISYSLDLIKEVEGVDKPKIIVATNNFHIFRSKLMAKSLGVKAYGLPAKTPPSIIVQQYIREYFAIVKFLLLSVRNVFK